MKTIAVLGARINGLIDFTNRLSDKLVSSNIRVLMIATSPLDIATDTKPSFPVLYFSQYLAHAGDQPATYRGLDILAQSFFKTHVNTSIFWPDIDRIISHSLAVPVAFERNDLAFSLFSFFADVIESHNVEMIIFEQLSTFFAIVAEKVCNYKSKVFASISAGRMPGRFEICVSPLSQNKQFFKLYFEDAATSPQKMEAQTYIDRIEIQMPEYMINYDGNPSLAVFAARYFTRKAIEKLFLDLQQYWSHSMEKNLSFYTIHPIKKRIVYFKISIRRYFNLMKMKKYFLHVVPNEEFALYPIHFHPEASTSVFGSLYQDEFHTICLLASCLPIGMKLVVKDHAVNAGFQYSGFYHDLSKIPNVVFMTPSMNIKDIIRKAKCVIVNTSTAGFEALAMGKFVFVLGSTCYDYVPWCQRVTTPEEIFERLKTEDLYEPTVEERLRFVAAYLAGTHAGVMDFNLELASPGFIDTVARWIEGMLCSSDTAAPPGLFSSPHVSRYDRA